MNLAHPWLLLLLLPLALAVLRAWRKPQPALRVPSLIPFRAASGAKGYSLRRLIPLALYAVGGVALVLALARPREGLEEIRQRSEGIDIMIAIDLSGSMAAYDAPENFTSQPQLVDAIKTGLLKSRLEIAKIEIRKFILARPNDRIGLVAFAPLPYVACPPTLDHGWLIANLERLEPGIIGDATGIAGPVASAVERLKDSGSKRRIVVLFTDGSNNVNAKVTPRQAAKLADTFNVTIYTVGIGSERAFILQNSLFGTQAIALQGEFDEDLLRDMASTTGGRYYRAADSEGMAKAMSAIDKLEKTSVEQPKIVNWREWGPSLCAAALGLLLLAFLLENSLLLCFP